MEEQLQRQIGPFKVWQWLLIVVVGVGLGIIIRKRMGASPTEPASQPANIDSPDMLPPTQGAPTIVQEDFSGAQAIRKDQDRFFDELEKREGELFAGLQERISAIEIPVEKTSTPKLSDLEAARQEFRAYFGVAPNPNESAARLRRRIRAGKQEKELQEARQAFRDFFGIEPNPKESADRLYRRIKAGKK